MTDDIKKRLDVVLVAGGKYHDIDFARLELLKLLAEDERIRTRVYEDYSNLHAISNADFLITVSQFWNTDGTHLVFRKVFRNTK